MHSHRQNTQMKQLGEDPHPSSKGHSTHSALNNKGSQLHQAAQSCSINIRQEVSPNRTAYNS